MTKEELTSDVCEEKKWEYCSIADIIWTLESDGQTLRPVGISKSKQREDTNE